MEEPQESDLPVLSPPARLHRVLVPIVDRADFDGQPAGQALARAMRIEPVDVRASWYLAHTELAELRNGAESFVRNQVAKYQESPHAATFRALFQQLATIALTDPWGAHRNNLLQLVTIALPFSVHAAELQVGSRVIPAAETRAIRDALRRLVDSVLASDYPAAFKDELIAALQRLIDRINRFDIFGPEGVKEATSVLVGTLTVNGPAAQTDAAIVRETADVVTKLADVFLKMYAVAQIAGAAVLRLIAR